jgi:hypothetical protein
MDRFASRDVVGNLSTWPLEEHHDVWAVAQHDGLPTRLLDWSKSPLVACYFAAASCLTDRRKPKMLAVWEMHISAVDDERLRLNDSGARSQQEPGGSTRCLHANTFEISAGSPAD